MISVQRPPTKIVSTIRVWMRPYRVGTIAAASDAAVARPAPPLSGRRRDAELAAEAEFDQVVGDLLGRDLQPEEGVDAGKVTAQGRAARRVQPARLTPGADHLEVPVHVQPADRVAAGTGMVQQVGQHPVFADVGLQARAVDDEVGVDLCGGRSRTARSLDVEVGDDALPVGSGPQLADLAGDGAVPAFPATSLELLLPVL